MIYRWLMLFLLFSARAFATKYYFDSAPFTTYAEFNPVPLNTSTNAGHTVKQLTSSCPIRFNATTAAVVITTRVTYLSTRVYSLFVDGAFNSSTTLSIAPPGDQWEDITLGSGFSGAHEYMIVCTNPLQGGLGNWFDESITVDTLNSVLHPNLPWRGIYGDSRQAYTASRLTTSGSPLIQDQDNATLLTDMWISASATGFNFVVSGVAGGKINPTGAANTGNIPVNVDFVDEWYGYNDEADMGTLGDAAYIALVASTNTMYDGIRAQIGPGKPVYSYAPFDSVTGDPAKRALVISAKKAAIAGRANFYWEDTDGWITATTAFMPDNVHQNVAGAAQLASHRTPIWGGYITTPTANITTLHVGWVEPFKVHANREEEDELIAA